jgi:hypothetical protein
VTGRRALAVALVPGRAARAEDGPLSRTCFWLVAAAVLARMGLSTNLLFLLHIDYAAPGGNPVIKIHPGTDLAVLAFAAMLLGSGEPLRRLGRHCAAFPSHLAFAAMMLLCIVHLLVNVGMSGAAVFVDSYLCAGLVAAVLVNASLRQRRVLAWLLVAMIALNALVAVGETLLQAHLIPLAIDGEAIMDKPGDFRGYALYDHPLTAAMITQMGLFLVLAMRLSRMRTAALLLLFLVGLIASGGRMAIAVAGGSLALLGGAWLLREAVTRRLDARMAALAAAAAVVTPLGLWVVIAETPIGIRLAGKLYFDESAEARNVQWHVLGLMDFRNLMLGTPIDLVDELCHQIGLNVPFSDIENFWLATFVTLGIVGFLYFLLGFLPFVLHLWRVAPFHGRVLLATGLLVASTSNSLSRKSNILVVLTASVLATTGFARGRAGAANRPGAADQGWRALAVGRPAGWRHGHG